jgi:hypothetical protein
LPGLLAGYWGRPGAAQRHRPAGAVQAAAIGEQHSRLKHLVALDQWSPQIAPPWLGARGNAVSSSFKQLQPCFKHRRGAALREQQHTDGLS